MKYRNKFNRKAESHTSAGGEELAHCYGPLLAAVVVVMVNGQPIVLATPEVLSFKPVVHGDG